MDNAEIIETFEVDFDRLILVGHKQGLSYPAILSVILRRLDTMICQCASEQWLNT